MSNNEILNADLLANAIVQQACEDYRFAIRGRCYNPTKMLRDVRTFFKSEWYKQLTTIDYALILAKLYKEWEEGQKLIKVGKDVDCPELREPYEFKCPLCGGTAIATVTRFKTKKCRNGTFKWNYYKFLTCECHKVSERILVKQEVITNENHQN